MKKSTTTAVLVLIILLIGILPLASANCFAYNSQSSCMVTVGNRTTFITGGNGLGVNLTQMTNNTIISINQSWLNTLFGASTENSSWNQTLGELLFTNQTYVDSLTNSTFNQALTDSLYSPIGTGGNGSWNQTLGELLFTNQTYVDAVNTTQTTWMENIFLKIADFFTKKGDGKYLYNDTDTIYLNETLLNETIDNRATGNFSWNQTTGEELFAPNTTFGIQNLVNATYVPYSGAVDNVDLDGHNITTTAGGTFQWVDKLENSTGIGIPPADTLRLYVEDFKGFTTYKYIDDTGMVRHLVRDNIFIGKNENGSTITAMSVVYDCGSSGNVPLLCPARADSIDVMPAIGITIEDINDGAFGRVMMVGLLESIDTSGWAEGDVLYVSDNVSGGLTTIPPITPNLTQEIGTVLTSGVGNGAIQIISRALTGDEFGTVNNFVIAKNLTVNGNYICNASDCFSLLELNATGTGDGNLSFNQSTTNELYAPNTTLGIQHLIDNSSIVRLDDNATFYNLTLAGNLSVDKIYFKLGEWIGNIIDGIINIFGGLRVEGAGNFSGTIYINNGTDISTFDGNLSFNQSTTNELYAPNTTLGIGSLFNATTGMITNLSITQRNDSISLIANTSFNNKLNNSNVNLANVNSSSFTMSSTSNITTNATCIILKGKTAILEIC